MGVLHAGTDLTIFLVICFIILIVSTTWMVRSYARSATPFSVKIVTGFSWFLTVSMCFLLPYDLLVNLRAEITADGFEVISWNTIYWSAFSLTWLVLPLFQDYYLAGDFDWKGKLKHAIRINLVFYLVGAVVLIIIIIAIAATQGLGPTELQGLLACLSNLFAMCLYGFFLGYGIVEVPRLFWNKSQPIPMQLKFLEFRAVAAYEQREVTKIVLYQTWRLIDSLKIKIPEQDHQRPYLDKIMEDLPAESEYDMETLGAPEHFDPLPPALSILHTKPAHDFVLKDLVAVHEHCVSLATRLWLMDTTWREFVDNYMYFDDLMRGQPPPLKLPACCRQNPDFAAPLRLKWALSGRRWSYRIMAILTGLLSIMLIWAEGVIPWWADGSPFNHIFDRAKESDFALGVALVALPPLLYLYFCAFFTTTSVRFSHIYHMHGRRRTDTNTLILNASLVLRLVAPLGYNFIHLLDASGTAFQGTIAKQDSCATGSLWLSLTIPAVAGLTFFNVYSRLIKCLCPNSSRFQHHSERQDQSVDEVVTEGENLLAGDARKRRHGQHDRRAADDVDDDGYIESEEERRRRERKQRASVATSSSINKTNKPVAPVAKTRPPITTSSAVRAQWKPKRNDLELGNIR